MISSRLAATSDAELAAVIVGAKVGRSPLVPLIFSPMLGTVGRTATRGRDPPSYSPLLISHFPARL
jgi:hypothetical protein